MTLAQLIPLVFQVSMGLVVFSLALRANAGDLAYLLRRPGLLLRSLVAMSVLMPLAAILIARQFHLRPAVETALILLAVSPVPPVLPASVSKAGGNVSYSIGLLTTSALFAIAVTPAWVSLISRYFGRATDVPASAVATTVGMTVLGPLILGAIVRRLVPAAVAWVQTIARIGTVVVLLAFAAVLFVAWRAILATIGDFTVVAIVVFVLVSLAVGHVLGGPDHEDRTVLALATASRHPGVALAVASSVAQEHRAAVAAAVLLAFLVGTFTTGAYGKWRKRSATAADPAAPTGGGAVS